MSPFPLSALILLGWGALVFGAEDSWAYGPLLVFSVVVGLLGLLASRTVHFPSRAVALVFVAIFFGGSLQLIPFSAGATASISPSSAAADYGQLYATATMRPAEHVLARAGGTPRPLSIEPSRTVLGLAFLGAFTILFVGCARGMSASGAHGIARGILALGLVVALVGIIQRASGSDAMYGFWYPRQMTGPNAPFANRNHFAGWMVMALSVSAGLFAGGVARGMRGLRPGWRNRVLWWSSSDAGETLLTAFALAVMALSIVLTVSRSGLLCLVVAIMVSGWWAARRQSSRVRRLIGTAYLVVVLVVAASWGDVDAVLRRFEGAGPGVGGRGAIWQDTMRIIKDFPLTGTGLNTYGIAMLHYQTVPGGELMIEAHNDYLQLAAEGGLLLGVPIVAALLLFSREVRRRFQERADDTATYWLRAGAVTGLCAIAAQETVEFTLQMPGAAVLFVVLAAIAIHRPSHAHSSAAPIPPETPRARSSRSFGPRARTSLSHWPICSQSSTDSLFCSHLLAEPPVNRPEGYTDRDEADGSPA